MLGSSVPSKEYGLFFILLLRKSVVIHHRSPSFMPKTPAAGPTDVYVLPKNPAVIPTCFTYSVDWFSIFRYLKLMIFSIVCLVCFVFCILYCPFVLEKVIVPKLFTSLFCFQPSSVFLFLDIISSSYGVKSSREIPMALLVNAAGSWERGRTDWNSVLFFKRNPPSVVSTH